MDVTNYLPTYKLTPREMADQLSLDLVGQQLVTNQLTLTVGYDIDNLRDPERRKQYSGTVSTDHYSRQIPKHAHGTANLEGYTVPPSSSRRRSWSCLTASWTNTCWCVGCTSPPTG